MTIQRWLMTMLALGVIWAGASPVLADDEGDQPTARRLEGIQPVAKGDLAAMRGRRLIRVLASPDDVLYRLQRQEDRGLIPQLAQELEQQLNRQRAPNQPALKVVMVPTPPDQLIPRLLAGQGDIIAPPLPMTPDHPKELLATLPMIADIEPVLVTKDTMSAPDNVADLSGKSVLMIAGHPGRLMLSAVNADLAAQQRPLIDWADAPDGTTENGLLDLVRIGAVDGVIVENYLAKLWDQWRSNLAVHNHLTFDKKSDLKMFVRADSPDLLTEINRLLGSEEHNAHQGWLDDLKKQRCITEVTASQELDRFEDVWPYFRDLAPRYGFDPFIIAGLAYQESRMKQSARGGGGATGIMQLMPATGNHPALRGISINGTARDNIEAGLRYLKMLSDRYLNNPLLNEHDRSLMVLLAYHRGPASLERARNLGQELGLTDLAWFHHTDQAVARLYGQEPVEYVRNIAKYAFVFRQRIEQKSAPVIDPVLPPVAEQEIIAASPPENQSLPPAAPMPPTTVLAVMAVPFPDRKPNQLANNNDQFQRPDPDPPAKPLEIITVAPDQTQFPLPGRKPANEIILVKISAPPIPNKKPPIFQLNAEAQPQ